MWANIYVISVLYVIGTSASWVDKMDVGDNKRNLLGQKTTMVTKSNTVTDSMYNIDEDDSTNLDGTYTTDSYGIELKYSDNDREMETQSSKNEEKDHDSFIYISGAENEDTEDNGKQTCVSAGFFPDPEDCSKFYRCVATGVTLVKHEFSCPSGTLWDNQLVTCNFPDQIQNLDTCKRLGNYNIAEFGKFLTPRIEDSSTIGDLSKDRFTIVCPSGFRQHSKYCNLFYQCIINNEMQGSVIMFGCPDGTIFDQERLLCVDMTHDCTEFKFDEQPNSIIIFHPANDVICPEEGQFPYSKFCTSKYFKCIRNEDGILEGYLVDCPVGNVYSSLSNYCVPPALYRHCMDYYQV
ncbi:uncharacterized protein LOC122534139 [Frieseomelitta varia]|uniref:uncharacterized protein LOC122534139 n=1 Tax=Frieseomelitta varia TaxID=561572 RepID=UPI001CB6A615|nr:uncharacterized protein LOC122534139 [Frieseomelitta varia]